MNELLEQGLSIMGIGMGTVLAFLCIMIFSMIIMSCIVGKLNKLFPEAVTQTGTVKKSVSDDAEIVVAIVASMLKK